MNRFHVFVFTFFAILVFVFMAYPRERNTTSLDSISNVSDAKIRVAFYTAGLGDGYFGLALEMYQSASLYFCVNNFVHVDYFVFSNKPRPEGLPSNFHIIPTVKTTWPFDSQGRFKWVHTHAVKNPHYDYILWMDADQLFERPICFDFLGELVAVAHSHYYEGTYPYESRPESKAFVPAENSRVQSYFSGQFFGGSYLKMVPAMKTMNDWVEEDTAHGIQALVDDESHLNAYFYHNFPTVVLSRIFVWPEGFEDQFADLLGRHGGRSEAAAIARLMLNKPRNDT